MGMLSHFPRSLNFFTASGGLGGISAVGVLNRHDFQRAKLIRKIMEMAIAGKLNFEVISNLVDGKYGGR